MPVTQEFKIKKALSSAKKLSTQRRFAEAIDIYNSILQLEPHNSAAKNNLFKLKKKLTSETNADSSRSNAAQRQPTQQQMDALVSLFNAGRMPEVETAARNLLSTYPQTLPLYNIYGAALLEQGKSRESLRIFEKATTLEPDNIETHRNLGNVLHRLGHLEKALRSYNKAIKIKPDQASAYAIRGNVFSDLGQHDEALKDYQKALQLKPEYGEVYFSFGNLLSNLGQLDEALANYDKCIKLIPDFVEAHVNRGDTLKKLGRLEEAITSYQKATELNPEKAEASINLGNILTSQGKFEQAVKLVQIPLEREPNNRLTMSCLVGALNYCSAQAEIDGAHAKLQQKLRKIEPARINTPNITTKAVQKLYQQCDSELTSSKLPLKNYSQTQIWRGRASDLECERHFVVFNNFNAIPRFCFSCYKVVVAPRTVVDLFKLMIVFDSLKLTNDNTRKCMIETRPKISGAYKGYVYCQGLDEGKEILKKVQQAVAERISDDVKVTLKRGCSEYALSYPEYVQSDENEKPVMSYKEEWAEHEDYTDKNLTRHIIPQAFDLFNHNHSGLTLHDAIVMHIWLAYAAAIGDSSYMEISGAPVEKLPIKKRPA